VINNFQIINETIVEVDEDASALATRLSSLNPELLAKVLENMTADEIRSLASLKPIVKPETPTA
jgi:methionyl-tRNA formyltransferase